MADFERGTTWTPAFDKRSDNPATNYGIHGMNLRFVLRGDRGAVQFLIFTSWFTEAVEKEHEVSGYNPRPMAADLGYHSPAPRYEGQGTFSCEYLPGGECYYDGSSLNAKPLYWKFVAEGEEAMWAALAGYYHGVFEMEVVPA